MALLLCNRFCAARGNVPCNCLATCHTIEIAFCDFMESLQVLSLQCMESLQLLMLFMESLWLLLQLVVLLQSLSQLAEPQLLLQSAKSSQSFLMFTRILQLLLQLYGVITISFVTHSIIGIALATLLE